MSERKNKPRVFVSHSKRDLAFIEKVCDELRRYQIEPWLDTDEIRHGQPWLDAIFEQGIPTCDCILVYLSEHSVESAMVRKEIDASILQTLRDSRIGFLPYVSDAGLRNRLRADIQALQAPEWNDDNYSSLLPRVVSEIWTWFLDRCVSIAVSTERERRLAAELELERLKKASGPGIFSDSEDRDFAYVWDTMNRRERVEFHHVRRTGKEEEVVQSFLFLLNVRSLIPMISDHDSFEYHYWRVGDIVAGAARAAMPSWRSLPKGESVELKECPDIGGELLMFGFVERSQRVSRGAGVKLSPFPSGPEVALVYTERIERFKYWLANKGLLPHSVDCVLDTSEPAAGDTC